VQYNDDNSNIDVSTNLEKPPYEVLEDSYQTMRHILMQDLLNKVKQNTAIFFEKMVVELLVKIGYDGSITDAGKAIGKSGDEGIDGVIKEDIFGLDTIYVQAKKWDSVVGRPELHKFAGALQGERLKKGIFITTGTFSKDAIEYISKIDSRIVLIDGNRLTELMIDNNVGVSILKNYEIKKIDSDYFTDEDVISH
jgi:restriction system protein